MDLLAATQVSPIRPAPTRQTSDYLCDSADVADAARKLWRVLNSHERRSCASGDAPYWFECEIRRTVQRTIQGFEGYLARACITLGRGK